MIATVIALVLAVSAGATVAVADNARPGDALFTVDRATEQVRLALAGDQKKDELRLRFSEERATEFESIVDEEVGRVRVAFEAKAKSSGDAEPEMALMAVSQDDSSARTASAPSEQGGFDSKGEARIAGGLSVAVGYLSQVSAELEAKGNTQAQEAVDAVIARLNAKIGGLPEELRARLRIENEGDDNEIHIRLKTEGESDDDADNKFEIRGEGVKTKVEFRGGEIKIESEADDDSDDTGDDSSDAALEIEADVFTDRTIVKVERNDVKELFITSAKTRAEVVAAIAVKFGMTEADVDAVLDFEVENRASRNEDLFLSGSSDDSNDDSSDDSANDDSGDDSDDDDDNSGSGKGGDDEDDD